MIEGNTQPLGPSREQINKKVMESPEYKMAMFVANFLVDEVAPTIGDFNMNEIMGYTHEHLTDEKLLEYKDKIVNRIIVGEKSVEYFGKELTRDELGKVFETAIADNGEMIRNRIKNITNTNRNKRTEGTKN